MRSYLEGRWEGKGTYVFYLELVTDLLHLCVYVVFFFIVFTNYGLPLHLARSACGLDPALTAAICLAMLLIRCLRCMPEDDTCLAGRRLPTWPGMRASQNSAW